MSLEDALQVLQNAEDHNDVLIAAMTEGPDTPEWTALEALFAGSPETLSGLPACRAQIINDGVWGGSNLGVFVPTGLKPTWGG